MKTLTACLIIILSFTAFLFAATRSKKDNSLNLLRAKVINLDEKTKEQAKQIRRYAHACEVGGIDSSKILDDAIWPEDKFDTVKVGMSAYLEGGKAIEVLQVIDNKSILCELPTSQGRESVIITNINTSNLVSDKGYAFETPFIVTGTTTYEAVLGNTKTVYTLEPGGMPTLEQLKKKNE